MRQRSLTKSTCFRLYLADRKNQLSSSQLHILSLSQFFSCFDSDLLTFWLYFFVFLRWSKKLRPYKSRILIILLLCSTYRQKQYWVFSDCDIVKDHQAATDVAQFKLNSFGHESAVDCYRLRPQSPLNQKTDSHNTVPKHRGL